MKLTELLGADGDAVHNALNLLQQQPSESIPDTNGNESTLSVVDFGIVTRILEEENNIELIKGLCFIVSSIAKLAHGEDYPTNCFGAWRASADIFAARQTQLSQDILEAFNFPATYATLDLLDSLAGNSSIFYMKLYSLEADPLLMSSVVIALISMFHSLIGLGGKDRLASAFSYIENIVDDHLRGDS